MRIILAFLIMLYSIPIHAMNGHVEMNEMNGHVQRNGHVNNHRNEIAQTHRTIEIRNQPGNQQTIQPINYEKRDKSFYIATGFMVANTLTALIAITGTAKMHDAFLYCKNNFNSCNTIAKDNLDSGLIISTAGMCSSLLCCVVVFAASYYLWRPNR